MPGTRAAMAARVPGIESMVGHGQFVDQMRHAAAMLMAAMEQKDRAFGRRPYRRPVAVKNLGAVMALEGALVRHARKTCRCCSSDGLVDHGFPLAAGSLTLRHQASPALRPLRIRLMAVTRDSVAMTGNTKGAIVSTHRPQAMKKPMTPSASTRSLLPNGPA